MLSAIKAFNMSTRGKTIDDIMKTIEDKIVIEASNKNFRAIFNNCQEFRDPIVFRLKSLGYNVKKFGKTSIEISWSNDPKEIL